jgi:Holliday junction resolvasome RuvABC DNA-binding subunit
MKKTKNSLHATLLHLAIANNLCGPTMTKKQQIEALTWNGFTEEQAATFLDQVEKVNKDHNIQFKKK